MKLLSDENLSFRLCDALEDMFPGSSQVRLARLERASDADVWRFAGDNDFVLVTQDSDFAELEHCAALHQVIWLRSGNRPTSAIAAFLRRNADTIHVLGSTDALACLEIY